MTTPDDEDALPPGADVDETNVRVVGGDAGWAPAEAPEPPIPVLSPESRSRTAPKAPIGTEASEPEVLHASTTVHAVEDWYSSFTPPPAADTLAAVESTTVSPVASSGTIIHTRARGDRWAPILSATLGTLVILAGLVLGAVTAYYYGDGTACAAYAKAHAGSTGWGCAANQRKLAVILPMLGFPLLVVGWLAAIWIPERSGSTRVKLCLGLLASSLVGVALVLLGISNAVR